MSKKLIKKTKPSQDLLAAAIGNAIDKYKIDNDSAYIKGVVFDIGGVTLHVRHAGNSNRDYARAIKNRAEEHKSIIEKFGDDTVESKEASERMMAEVFTESVIVGVSIAGKKHLWDKETKKAIEDMLCAVPEKFDELVAFSLQIENYRIANRKVAEKN